MEISSNFVGRRSKTLRVKVTDRDAVNYSAGCYITNPIFYDDRNKLLVFPMLVVSLTWKISSSFENFWDTSGFPLKVLNTQVHYFEDLTWYRRIYGGDSISISGEVISIIPHISGTLLCIEYVGFLEDGSPLFKEITCSLLRGVKCIDKGNGKDRLPIPIRENLDDLKFLWEEPIDINFYDPYTYDGCSNIHFPIHTSYKFAESVGLPAPIYQGTALLSRVLQKFIDRKDFSPEKKFVKSLHARFASYVLPGNKLNIKVFKSAKNKSTDEVYFFEVLNLDNKPITKEGKIEFVDATSKA